ncbi:MAG: hypothetical protein Q8K36_07275 [Alphaproteobacteria bacterium]|nr:hypothetical protein [Alphaproteobacteria bacterium]
MNFEIDKNIEKQFLKTAQHVHKDPAKIIEKLLVQYMEDVQDYEAGVLGHARYIKSGRQGISLEQIKKRLEDHDN